MTTIGEKESWETGVKRLFSPISWKFRTFLSSVTQKKRFQTLAVTLVKAGVFLPKNIFPFPLSEKKVAVQVYFEKQVHSPSPFIFAKR